jgi:hypothetical protein
MIRNHVIEETGRPKLEAGFSQTPTAAGVGNSLPSFGMGYLQKGRKMWDSIKPERRILEICSTFDYEVPTFPMYFAVATFLTFFLHLLLRKLCYIEL